MIFTKSAGLFCHARFQQNALPLQEQDGIIFLLMPHIGCHYCDDGQRNIDSVKQQARADPRLGHIRLWRLRDKCGWSRRRNDRACRRGGRCPGVSGNLNCQVKCNTTE